jgi:four helix bundle protein
VTGKIRGYEDLEVYQRLVDLHLEVHAETMKFPKYELYELGSQPRRSSNSIPANIAEGWNNKHTNMYLEGINRALGELRETRHHLLMAFKKDYVSKETFAKLSDRYEECARMLTGLERAVTASASRRKNS